MRLLFIAVAPLLLLCLGSMILLAAIFLSFLAFPDPDEEDDWDALLADSQSNQAQLAPGPSAPIAGFTLEDSIPLPASEPGEIAPEQEDTRWQPFQWKSTRQFHHKCANNVHRPMVGRCELCGDVFPCPSGNCGHWDCAAEGSGTAVPEFVG
jgi:hypothetical protein